MRQNGDYLFVYGEKFTDIRTRMTIAAERNDQIATARYFAERKIGGHTEDFHGSDSRNIDITICHFPTLYIFNLTW